MRFNPLINPILTPGQARTVVTFKPLSGDKLEAIPREDHRPPPPPPPPTKSTVRRCACLDAIARVPDSTLAFLLQSAMNADRRSLAVPQARIAFAEWLATRKDYTDWRIAFTDFAAGYTVPVAVELRPPGPRPPAPLPTTSIISDRWLARLRNRQPA